MAGSILKLTLMKHNHQFSWNRPDGTKSVLPGKGVTARTAISGFSGNRE